MMAIINVVIPGLLALAVLLSWVGTPIAIGFFVASFMNPDAVIRSKRRKIALWALSPIFVMVFCIIFWGIVGYFAQVEPVNVLPVATN